MRRNKKGKTVPQDLFVFLMLGLLAAVGSGAAGPPRLIVMTYMWGCRGGIT